MTDSIDARTADEVADQQLAEQLLARAQGVDLEIYRRDRPSPATPSPASATRHPPLRGGFGVTGGASTWCKALPTELAKATSAG